MKHMKKYIALLLALLCLLTLWGCGEKAVEEKEPEQEDPQQQEEEVQQTTVLSDVVECSNGSRTLRFQRNEKGNWEWKDDPDFPLDDTHVKTLLATVEAMMALEPIETDKTPKSLNLEEDDTGKYITASNEKGETITWYLGKKHDSGSYYMRLDGDVTNAIYLSPTDLSAQIGRSIYDMMILPQLPAMAAEKISCISIQAGDTTQQFQLVGDKWFDAGQVNVTGKLQPLLNQLAAPELAACVDYKPSKGAPAICGLSKPTAVLTVEYTDQFDAASTFTLSIGNTRGEGYCVTINDDSTIYLMDPPLVKAVLSFVA